MGQVLTTCTFCGVGCGLYLETAGNQIVGVYPSMSHPTNAGRICVRGWHVHEIASSPQRLKSPLLRRNGTFEEVTWEEALGFLASRLQEIRDQHGPDSIAFLNSPRCSNEETYLLQKFARTVIGTNNVDHGAGVYCNNSVDVLLEMIGVSAATNSLEELGQSEVIVLDGVDLARQLTTLGGIVIRAKLKGARLIVIDSRRHRVAENADLFLEIRPGTETLLYGAMAKLIQDRGLMNSGFIKERCCGYEAFREQLGNYDLLQSAEACGVEAELIEAAALDYAQARSAALLYSTGNEARPPESVRAMVNLALLTGNLGKPGCGIFPLSEHNNLQGVCDMGMMPDRLPGYRRVADKSARSEFETLWKTRVPAAPGHGARAVLNDLGHGSVKALWLSHYDPVSTAFVGDASASLSHCELVVAQHLFLTETARYAHVVLPTVAFGEERASFTNTERRIQLAEKAVEPPAGPRPAWQQIAGLAHLMGADWNYSSAEEVMEEIAEAIPFYGGASYENLARQYGRQWPCTKDKPLGTRFLLSKDAGSKPLLFVPVSKPNPVAVTEEFPLMLVFGQTLYYWDQNVVVRHSETLRRESRILLLDYPDGFVEINTEDAKRFGIRDGEKIRLWTDGASAVSTARVTPEVRCGSIFVPYFTREVERQIFGAMKNGARYVVPVRVVRETA